MRLAEDRRVTAVIKASDVILAVDDQGRADTRRGGGAPTRHAGGRRRGERGRRPLRSAPMQARARLRTAGTLAACAYAVHSLRYFLAYGSHAQGELQRQGHAYLSAAPVLLTALLALGAGELLRAAARGERAPGATPPLLRAWALASGALLALFCVQELLEGMLAAGHPAGLQAVAAGGGWLAVPLSCAFGLLATVLGRGARAVLAAGPPRLGLPAPPPEASHVGRPAQRAAARRGALRLDRGRAPPALA